jgi:hypothetical protein
MTQPKMAMKKATEPSNYQSGFCGIGSHENSKAVSPSGKPLKTCPVGGRIDMITVGDRNLGEAVCECDCHTMSRKMEEMSGVKFPARNSIKDSSPLSTLGLLRGHGAGTDGHKGPGTVDDGRPTVTVASGARFAETPTGRAARGQLEEQVRYAVCTQVKAAGHEMIAILGLTPKLIGDIINREDPPSSGAIYAVLKRWDSANLIDMAESPVRFVRFTDRGKRDLFK